MTRISKILEGLGFKKVGEGHKTIIKLPEGVSVKYKCQGAGKPLIAEVTIDKPVCPICKGSGETNHGMYGEVVSCYECEGKGYK